MEWYIYILVFILGNVGYYLRIELGGGFESKREALIGFVIANLLIVSILVIMYFYNEDIL